MTFAVCAARLKVDISAREEANERSLMKVFSVLSITALLVFAGCATQRRVAELRGHGTREYYSATFDQTWRAAIDAAQAHSLDVVTADRNRGYIGARRTIQPHTFGENVGIWVRQSAAGLHGSRSREPPGWAARVVAEELGE